MTEAIPQDVRDLLDRHLSTMEHVEVVLALAGDDSRAWPAAEVATRVHAEPASVSARLAELEASGLVTRDASAGADAFRYSPQTAELGRAIESLAEMYRTKPVTLIKAIYARPASAVQSFADAFRVRKPEA